MRAMALHRRGQELRLIERGIPSPGRAQIRVKVAACGVCRTDLHVVDGELPDIRYPIVPGHEIVGRIDAAGEGVTNRHIGERVGVPWLGNTCDRCPYCLGGRENLCDNPQFTGYTLDGGYADYALADANYAFALPDGYSDTEAAPLLCAGLIGYRSLRMAGDAEHLGIYGFGAAAHIVTQVALYQGRKVYAFTRPGDKAAQKLAHELRAVWTGASNKPPPRALDAAILFVPVGNLVPAALTVTAKGGTVVCGGIHMSDVPSFPYSLLWGERVVRSVANLTREDARQFLELAPKVPVRTTIETFPVEEANEALRRLRAGDITGAAVLSMN
jgi:propanol-preferring alcohol dehydrogenase